MSDPSPAQMDRFPAAPLDGVAAERHIAQLQADARHRLAQTLAASAHSPRRTVGICGAGLMGTGIAWAALQAGFHVTLHDVSADSLDCANRRLSACRVSTGKPARELFCLAATPDALAACDLLIESVVEDRELKRAVLRRVTALLPATAVVATNTSTIPLAELSAAVVRPERFCGLHFCHPVEKRLAVEVIPCASTDAMTLTAAQRFVSDIGQIPVLVRDSPGFVVNRLLLPYLNEAIELLCDRVDPLAIDRAAMAFGMQWGPFETFDQIGLDTALRAGRTLWEAFPDRIRLTPVLPRLVKLGRLGRKVGKGFWAYPETDINPGLREPGVPDPALEAILAPYMRSHIPQDDGTIAARLVLSMLLEATRVLEEGLVERPHDIDVVSVFGLAFPRVRGGLLHWADQVGLARIVAWLRALEPLGARMRPTPLLESLAAAGGSFYS